MSRQLPLKQPPFPSRLCSINENFERNAATVLIDGDKSLAKRRFDANVLPTSVRGRGFLFSCQAPVGWQFLHPPRWQEQRPVADASMDGQTTAGACGCFFCAVPWSRVPLSRASRLHNGNPLQPNSQASR